MWGRGIEVVPKLVKSSGGDTFTGRRAVVDLSATTSNLKWGRGIAPVPSNNNRDSFRLGQFDNRPLRLPLYSAAVSWDGDVPIMLSHGLIGRSLT